MAAGQPVRIVFAITSLRIGGAEQALVDLVTHLAPERFRPVVVSLAERPEHRQAALARKLEARRVAVHYLDVRHHLHAPAAVRRLARLLREEPPAILQTFLAHANTLGAVAGRMARVPHIVAGIRVAERRANFHRSWTRWTARWIERHVCVSRSVADFVQQTVGLPASSIEVIPTGVELERFRTLPPAHLVPMGLPTGRRALLYVGRLTRQKRVDWLIRRAPALLAALPDHDLLLVGQGQQQSRLQRLARDLGVGQRVHFAGWQTDVPAVLAAADLLLLTSRWEGLPRVVLEAMASAKPVVATAAEGIDELLRYGTGQQVVGRDDSQAFVAAVVRIARDPERAHSLGLANRRRVEQHFSIDQCVAAYQRLYESLLEGGRREEEG